MAPFWKKRPSPGGGRAMEEAGSHSTLESEKDFAGLGILDNDNSDAISQKSNSSPSHLERPSSARNPNQASSHAPIAPSPLYHTSSQSSMNESNAIPTPPEESSQRNSSSSGDEAHSQPTNSMLGPAKGKRSTNTLYSAQQILRQKSAVALSPEESISGAEAPKHLQDLGRDYSRYPPSSSSVRPNSRAPSNDLAITAAEAPLLGSASANPFSDSKAELEKFEYPDDRIGAFDPYYGGEKGFILYANELEADDKLHMPADDDDLVYKTKFSDYFGRRQIVSTLGAILIVLGILSLFVILPALTYARNSLSPPKGPTEEDFGPAWARVNNNTYPLMKNVRRGLIDPDTPDSVKTRKSAYGGSDLKLVFSDEFSQPNRTFYPGDDPYWTGADIWYGATQDFEWYDPDAITTGGGTLQLRLDAFPNHGLQYRSGMLNSWNQLCFKGGVFEVSVSLAGPAGVPGLWPGVWSMGNLGRPGFKATTEGVWPYTYDNCDAGITPNQSVSDGLSFLPGQKLSSCTCNGEDHPNPGTGRGAPELDILEGSVDPINKIGVVTQSLQVAPFDVYYRPNSNFLAIPNYETTQMNGYCGGPFQQAVSATSMLNNAWYDEKAYQKYAYEYYPGTSSTGKITWFVGEDPTFQMDGRSIGPNGNIGARQIPQEPMSMILNLGFSASWTQIDQPNLKFPTIMHIDYVRIYQKSGEETITCDPPGYPTTQYIKDHPVAYRNPNMTAWNETGYAWPKNTLTGC
ncbi:Concanavalin A-like lectin [Venustampulla echinocandica]|uniref:Concanavalin A-like lectin n=1 Tax=Venustampulla echinocandica TaxID=2656787 RepID=A0A370TJP1_9HELO|nr:Concanavalin A-like lectin [Venustampulla echinocandica]RDL35729.1 Concanavalin A-like lectin [Venustampulla echinocandica]